MNAASLPKAAFINFVNSTQSPPGYPVLSLNWKYSTLSMYYKRNMERWRRPPSVRAFLAAPCTRRSRSIDWAVQSLEELSEF